jgi:hypothetical protein
MQKFEAIDAELSALTAGDAAVSRALEAVRIVRSESLDSLASVDALLASLGDVSKVVSTQRTSAPLDVDSLFEDAAAARPSMMAPMYEAPDARPSDMAPSAAGDLAGLLEGSNSLMPPPLEDDYEEMRMASVEIEDEGPPSTEIEILED